MFEEIDYILEGQNAERFACLYADYSCKLHSSFKDVTLFIFCQFSPNFLDWGPGPRS